MTQHLQNRDPRSSILDPRRAGLGLLLVLAAFGLAGCGIRKAMYDQPRYDPFQASDFFGDARSARPLLDGTIARGHLNDDKHLVEGKVDGKPAETFPFPIEKDDLVRGRERYNIFCAPCHDQAGTGLGMVVQRGYKQPPSYHIDRLRQSPPGYYYDVIARGFGQMPSYAAQIPVEDRWRIVAYVRALQLSRNARLEDVPAAERAALDTK